MSAATDAILGRLMALHPKVIDMSLDRLTALLTDLGNPHLAIPPVIHVAGTNGKGSTQAYIRAGLESAGMRVHAYTSPHLAFFNERIRLAGRLIDDARLAATLDEVERVNAGRPITFFEITTAAAFLAFSRETADFTLLEVGLGGRLDATNVVPNPKLCIITPVSIDHTQYLGETLAEIAGEKAGILKRGVPCVVARQDDDALRVIEARAARLGCPLSVAGQDWTVMQDAGSLVFEDGRGLMDLPLPALPGPHQIDNAGTALAALRALGFGPVEGTAAMTRVEWPARMQRLSTGPLAETAAAAGCELWLDGGHNPAGGAAVAATLAGMPRKKTHLICGMLNTKDVSGYMRALAPAAASLTAVDIPGEPNTLPAAQTADAATGAGLKTSAAPDVGAAVSSLSAQHPGARLLICGSLYLAGQVLRENG